MTSITLNWRPNSVLCSYHHSTKCGRNPFSCFKHTNANQYWFWLVSPSFSGLTNDKPIKFLFIYNSSLLSIHLTAVELVVHLCSIMGFLVWFENVLYHTFFIRNSKCSLSFLVWSLKMFLYLGDINFEKRKIHAFETFKMFLIFQSITSWNDHFNFFHAFKRIYIFVYETWVLIWYVLIKRMCQNKKQMRLRFSIPFDWISMMMVAATSKNMQAD